MIDGEIADADENSDLAGMTKASDTVRQRLKDGDEAHEIIQEIGSRGRVRHIEKSG